MVLETEFRPAQAAEVCYPGIKAKFCQNLYAMDCLIRKTGSKRIVECAADRL